MLGSTSALELENSVRIVVVLVAHTHKIMFAQSVHNSESNKA